MKKIVYSILIMITVLLAFSVCVYANNDISYSNGTDVYSNGIIEFYSNMDDEDKLYKLNLSDMTEEKVLDEHIISMVHKDNYLYLLVYANENSNLLKFDIQDNSVSVEMNFDKLVNNIVLRDYVIYYVKEQKIFAYDLLTKDNDALVTKENVDYIYFTEYNTLKYLVESDNNYNIKIYDFNVKETEKNDVAFFSLRSENEISLMSASSYSPRLSAPSTTNSYYMHTSYGGLNECIHISGGSVLPNCTGYAWGRSYENLGSRPNLSKNNAERWYGHNKDNGYYSYGEKPALGAVACWRKGILGNDPDVEGEDGGHVAVVEVIDGDAVITSESGYGGDRWFKTTRSAGDSNFSKASPYVFQGFIYVCGTNSTPEEPEIHTHSYIMSKEAAHPHRMFKICSCGDYYYTGETDLQIAQEAAHPHRKFYVCGVESCSYNKTYTGEVVEVLCYENNYPYKEYMACVEDCSFNGAYTGNTALPHKPALNDIKKIFNETESVILSWDNTTNSTHYNLYVDVLDKGEYVRSKTENYVESGLEQSFKPGKYRVCLQAINSNYWTEDGSTQLYTDSDWYYFEVVKATSFTTSTVTKNGTIYSVETVLSNFLEPYDILIIGYKGNQFVTMKRVPHDEQNFPYTLEGDIDKIKVMVWSDLSTLKPLCEAEEITSDKFIVE